MAVLFIYFIYLFHHSSLMQNFRIKVRHEFVILPPPSLYQYSFSTFLFVVLTESLLFHIVAEIITLYATSVHALFPGHFSNVFCSPAGIIRSCFTQDMTRNFGYHYTWFNPHHHHYVLCMALFKLMLPSSEWP